VIETYSGKGHPAADLFETYFGIRENWTSAKRKIMEELRRIVGEAANSFKIVEDPQSVEKDFDSATLAIRLGLGIPEKIREQVLNRLREVFGTGVTIDSNSLRVVVKMA